MGFFTTLAIWAALYILHRLLQEPTEEEERRKAQRIKTPQVSEGVPVPIAYGTVRTGFLNAIWYGKPLAVPVTERPSNDPADIIAYKYGFTGIAYGVALGTPSSGQTVVKKILVAEQSVWSGSVSSSGTLVSIDSPDLWGGPGEGGGVDGAGIASGEGVVIYTGTFSQSVQTDFSATRHGNTAINAQELPAWRGLVYLYAKDLCYGESPHIPSLEVDLTVQPTLFSPSAIDTDDANPAGALWDFLVRPWGGLGLPASFLDFSSFSAAAATLGDETHGFSALIQGPERGVDLVSEILRQIDGVLYQDPSTQTLVLKLIRDDYDPGSIPLLDESEIIEVLEYQESTFADTYNQVRVIYEDRDQGYKERVAFAQDDANIAIQGRVRTTEVRFLGVKNGDLAARLAQRELRTVGTPTARAKIVVTRAAFSLRPGDPFKISWSQIGVSNKVFRVVSFDLGTLEDNRITIECLEDKFATDPDGFVSAPPEGQLPVLDPAAAADLLPLELPRWFGVRLNLVGQQFDDERAYLLYLAERPDAGHVSFHAEVSDDAGTTFTRVATGVAFAGRAEVNAAYSRLLEPYDTTEGLTIDSLSEVTALRTATATQIREDGRNLVLVGDEAIAYESFTDNLDGTYTLNNVWRGLLDTVPVAHAVDEEVWFLTEGGVTALSQPRLSETGDRLFPSPQALLARARTRNATHLLPAASAPLVALTTDDRSVRPLPPALFRVDGSNDPGEIDQNEVLVTWLGRHLTNELVARGDDAHEVVDARYDVEGKLDSDGSWTELLADQEPADPAAGLWAPLHDLASGPSGIRSVAERDPGDGFLAAQQAPVVSCDLLRFRQLLLNVGFDDSTTPGRAWSEDTGTPGWSTSGSLGDQGIHLTGSAAEASLVVSQEVPVLALSPSGLDALLTWHHRTSDGEGNDTVTVVLESLDSGGSTLDTQSSGAVSPASGWARSTVSISSLDPDTESLRVTVTLTRNGMLDVEPPETHADEFDLRISPGFTAEQLTNGGFETGDTTGWTVGSGSWRVAGTTGGLTPVLGEFMLLGGASSASHELYQEVTLPGGVGVGDVAWLWAWRAQASATHEGEIVLEARDGDDTVLGSVTTGQEEVTEDAWNRRHLYLTIPTGTAKIRVRLLGTRGAGSDDDSAFDALSLRFLNKA